MTEAFGPLRGFAIVIPNEVRNLREAIILESIGHKEKIAPRRFLAPQTSLGMTRLLVLQNTAPRFPRIEKFTNSERSESPSGVKGSRALLRASHQRQVHPDARRTARDPSLAFRMTANSMRLLAGRCTSRSAR